MWLKCECLQTGGAFKLRGATNRLLQLSDGGAGARRGRFLVGQSCARGGDRRAAARHSGDHRHALRRAGSESRGHARRRRGDRLLRPPDRKPRGDRGAAGRRDAARPSSRASTIPQIVAGQGTVGLEILEQLAEAGALRRADRHSHRRRRAGFGDRARLPGRRDRLRRARGWDDMRRSLELGADRSGRTPTLRRRLRRAPDAATFRRSRFGILRAPEAIGVAVSEDEVAEAVRFAWSEHQLVVEPGGAVALGGACSRARSSADGDGGGAVRRERRSGAARRWSAASCVRQLSMSNKQRRSGDAIFARLEHVGTEQLDRAGQLLELGGKRLQLGRKRFRVRIRRLLRRRRAASRASSRCTAGSFPRSARTPLRGAPAGRP